MTLKTIKTVGGAPAEAAAESRPAVAAGTLAYVDLYEITEVLPGGSSPLFRAKKIGARFGELVVRPLAAEVVVDADQLEKVKQGFLRLVALRHANIVPMLGVHNIGEVRYTSDAARVVLDGVVPGGVLVLTQFAPGRTLDVWRNEFEGGKIPSVTVLDVAHQLASALDYAHKNKILHLDLKPQNVMVETRKGGKPVARMMDFCPMPEVVGGTIEDDRCGMAMLVLEMLSGGSSSAAVDKLPPGIAAVFKRILDPNSEQPFKNCTEFVKALEKAVNIVGARPRRQRRLVLAGLGLLLLASCGVAGYSHVLANRRVEAKAEEARAAEERANLARLKAEKAAAEAKAAAEKAAAEAKAREEAEKARLAAEKAAAEAKLKEESDRLQQERLKAQADRLIAEREAAERMAKQREKELAEAQERAAMARRNATVRARRLFFEAKWREALEAARHGDLEDPEIQYRIGNCLLGGLGTSTNIAGGVKLITTAADKQWPAALTRLGELCLAGIGCETNEVKAAQLFAAAAEKNDPEGHWRLAQCLERGVGLKATPDEAVQHIESAAKGGHVRAQYAMGFRTKDKVQAAQWFRKAAEKGYPPAQAKYGDCLIYGLGVEKDSSAAVRWYTRAAEGGDAAGQRALGLCYDSGNGVKEDSQRAAALYKSAAEGGDLLAKALYSQCLFLGLGVAPDYPEAWRLARESADAGCAFGQYMAGICCETGKGAIRSRLNAKLWYEKAIEQGLECARERLDRMHIK